MLTQLVVSSDDHEILRICDALGCKVVERPSELAGDESPMLGVVQHTLETLEKGSGNRFDFVVLLQPTTPLRISLDIDRALEVLIETGADSVVSVYQVSDHHPSRMYRLENGRLLPYAPEPLSRLRQDLPAVYLRNGAVYALRRSLVDEQQTLIGTDIRPYVMPAERSINIDSDRDLLLADLVLSKEVRQA
jgi:CMP-N-acetylneuraminic acid synthetase